MGRIAVLAGVAHDIAHHAASGLSYLSPHLALALRAAGLQTTQMSLLDTGPYPDVLAEYPALRLALAALHCIAWHGAADLADARSAGIRSVCHGFSRHARTVG